VLFHLCTQEGNASTRFGAPSFAKAYFFRLSLYSPPPGLLTPFPLCAVWPILKCLFLRHRSFIKVLLSIRSSPPLSGASGGFFFLHYPESPRGVPSSCFLYTSAGYFLLFRPGLLIQLSRETGSSFWSIILFGILLYPKEFFYIVYRFSCSRSLDPPLDKLLVDDPSFQRKLSSFIFKRR